MFGSFTNALVNSGHDHWYYLLYNIKQRVQNCLFPVVTSSSQYLGLLKSLQWLPIKSRIIFKLNLWYIGLNIVYWQALVSRCFITFQELSANTEIRNYEAATSRTSQRENTFIFRVCCTGASCPRKHNTLNQCWLNVAHRLRRWPNIQPTLFQCVVFAGNLSRLVRCPSDPYSIWRADCRLC